MSTISEHIQLAYEDHGAGAPVVLRHGLTFDRTTWRPITERLGDGVRSVAIDLPGHGDSAGSARSLLEVGDVAHALVVELGIERPIVVGHSISGAIASIYAATYPVRGVVNVDNPVDIRPFARLVRRLAPALNGAAFWSAFEPLQQSMRLDLIPAQLRPRVRAAQTVRPEVILGYWDQILRTDPEELQAWIERSMQRLDAPYLAIFGRELGPAERDHMVRAISGLQLEEWPGSGHFVHLSNIERFTARLRTFIEHCQRNPGQG